MVAYFPAVYPGELLYSIVARCIRHAGAMRLTAAVKALFDYRLVVASPDLPGHLRAMAERIPSERGLDVDRLIDETTLFPYYTAFQPPELRIRVRRAMCEGIVENVHLRLGLPAFRIGRITTLRFCLECLEEMRAQYGEYYWRRDHQLPGAVLCADHGIHLRESSVCLSRLGRHEFVAATPATCQMPALSPVESMSPSVHDLLFRLTKQSVSVLNQPIPARSFEDWTAFYRNRMAEAGLARSAGTMNQQELEQTFARHLGDSHRHLPSAVLAAGTSAGWLATMVRKHRHGIHPLMHLLLQDFLAKRPSPPSFFGTGPWECRNPLAHHRDRHAIKVISQHRDGGRLVGVFRCRCGYVYTRGVDPVTGVLGSPRFQSYGPLLQSALEKGVARGMGLRELARHAAIDPKTLVRLASALGVATPWKAIPRRANRSDRFQAELKEVKANTVAINNAESRSHTRRDWKEVDSECIREIRKSFAAIRGEIPPVRVTRAEIERRSGRRDWLLARREKLPRATAFLERVVESVADFQLRRIHWAIAALERDQGDVKAWQVMRKAGLRGSELVRIQAILDLPSGSRRRAA